MNDLPSISDVLKDWLAEALPPCCGRDAFYYGFYDQQDERPSIVYRDEVVAVVDTEVGYVWFRNFDRTRGSTWAHDVFLSIADPEFFKKLAAALERASRNIPVY